MKHKDYHDIAGGLIMSGLGVFAALYARQYEFGELNRMGPGYFPVALGIALAVFGLMIAIPAFFRKGHAIHVEWKTFALVIGSLLVFAFTLKVLGLIFATVASCIVSTLADRETRWKGRLMIAGGVALITYIVFGLGLRMVLPIWPWSN